MRLGQGIGKRPRQRLRVIARSTRLPVVLLPMGSSSPGHRLPSPACVRPARGYLLLPFRMDKGAEATRPLP
jgi:hypothetical protein